MIVTEEEAKTKICCGGEGCGERVVVREGVVTYGSYERRCIGADCMAWRWIRDRDPNYPSEIGPETAEGFCGKAGRP